VLAFGAHAQTPLGTVTGLAKDPSGGSVPNASVTLTNQDTGVRRAASTNTSGAYSFPDLAPGVYKLEASAKGFRSLSTRGFPVEAYGTVRQDLNFEIAADATEVLVTEAAPAAIEMETPAVGSVLLARQIIEAPTNLRSISKNSGDSGLISEIMPLTVPGVVQVGNGAKWLTPGAGATGIKVKVDGIETTFGNFGSPDNVSQPSVEAVQEFTANVLTTRAEFGGMGTVTTATKSGGNHFHGGLFWYVRNSATDARSTFSTTKPFQNLHNYGGTDFLLLRFRRHAWRGGLPVFAQRAHGGHAAGGFHRPGGAQESVHRSRSVQREYDSGAVPQPAGAPTAESLPANAEFRSANADGGELSRVVRRAGSAPHRGDQAGSQFHRAQHGVCAV
jgi:hypothetical protein